MQNSFAERQPLIRDQKCVTYQNKISNRGQGQRLLKGPEAVWQTNDNVCNNSHAVDTFNFW